MERNTHGLPRKSSMRRESKRSLRGNDTELLAVHSPVTTIGLRWTELNGRAWAELYVPDVSGISRGESIGDVCMKATLLLAAEGIYRQRAGSGDLRTIVKHPSSTWLLKAACSQSICNHCK